MDRGHSLFVVVPSLVMIATVLVLPAAARQPARPGAQGTANPMNEGSRAFDGHNLSADEQSHTLNEQVNQRAPQKQHTVAPGTRFLVRLESGLDSSQIQENTRFEVTTLEPLDANNGLYLRPGAIIGGHVRHVDPAARAGCARLWLTFDEIETQFGSYPLVAEVVSVPGDGTVTAVAKRQGLIAAKPLIGRAALGAAIAGAAIGALPGVNVKDVKIAVGGAAFGALYSFAREAGTGHEVNLPQGEKLELVLRRTLYIGKY